MKKFKRIYIKVTYIILSILIICSLGYIVKYYYDIYDAKKESKLLKNIASNTNLTSIKKSESIEDESSNNTPQSNLAELENERIARLKKFQEINSDIVAWIEIENTNINYPVLQTSNNNYYMNHNYKKEYSTNGSIFLDKDYCWEPPSVNLLIYGHNNKNGTMFQDLLLYKSQTFYQQHPTIKFTTANEDATYEIIAVFQSRVYYQRETNVFRYYYFINCNTKQEYDDYINSALSSSLYSTGKTANYKQQLLTLSTCSYHIKNGRFAIVAKKQSP